MAGRERGYCRHGHGAVAGQEVWHVHLHVLPRFADDGFKLSARFQSPDRAELDATAAQIRAVLTALS